MTMLLGGASAVRVHPLRDWGAGPTATGNAATSGTTKVTPYTAITAAVASRIQFVTTPTPIPGHPFCTRIEVQNGDGGGSTWRAELDDWSGSPTYIGTEFVNTDFYYPVGWYFPTAYVPQAAGIFGVLMQFHCNVSPNVAGPSFAIEAVPGGAGLRGTVRSGDAMSPTKTTLAITGTLTRDIWHELVIHYKRRSGTATSPAAQGLVEIWWRLQGNAWPGSPTASLSGVANYITDSSLSPIDSRPQALQKGFYRDGITDGNTQIFYTQEPWRCSSLADAMSYFHA